MAHCHNEPPKTTTCDSSSKFSEEELRCALAPLVETAWESNLIYIFHKKKVKQELSFLLLEVPLTGLLSCHKVTAAVSGEVLSEVIFH